MVLTHIVSALAGVIAKVPVDPNAPHAQQWLQNELAKAEYQKARPSWFDQIASALANWLSSLKPSTADGPPSLAIFVVIAIIVAAIVVAFLIFGVPRANRRSSASSALFGENDERSAAEMRLHAESAAANGDFATAIVELFRAIARGLAERSVLSIYPGTTAHDFAIRAGDIFPELSEALSRAAAAFDGVRYLGGEGTDTEYSAIARLERQLRSARPIFENELA